MMSSLYLIDASAFLFRAYYAITPMHNDQGENTQALYGFIRSIQKLEKDFSPQYMACIFENTTNKDSRKKIFTEYKSNRGETPQDLPQQIQWAKQFCTLSGISHYEIDGYEADDLLGSIAFWGKDQDLDVFLCSSDKDLFQLVDKRTVVLNIHKDNLIINEEAIEQRYGISPNKFIDWLAIVGDTSDNIPGIPGFGPKTATHLLNEFGSLQEILDNPLQVLGKKKQATLIENREQALISQELATIQTTLPFEKSLQAFEKKTMLIPELKTFYSDKSFHSLLKDLACDTKVIPKLPTFTLVETSEQLFESEKYLKNSTHICFTTQTTSIKPMQARLVGIGLYTDKAYACYIPFNGPIQTSMLEDFLSRILSLPCTFFGHNIKYDLHVLANHKLPLPAIDFDTILASHLLQAHQRHHSLDYLCQKYFNYTKTDIQTLIGKGRKKLSMQEVPLDKLARYCIEDLFYTYKLRKLLEKQLKERKLEDLLNKIEIPLITILFQMERRGAFIHLQTLQQCQQTLCEHIKILETSIYDLAGEEFLINSPKQLSRILFEKLQIPSSKKIASGFSTNAEVLQSLKFKYPIAEYIIRYRTLEKLRSTYLDSLPNALLPSTQRIHSTFNQFSTATGRLSSHNPNLQNIPIRTEEGRWIRQAFQPQHPDWVYLSADYSQIELRLLAHFSEDPFLIQAFQEDLDIHRMTASLVFDTPIGEVTSEQRYQAKAVNFGVLYGQQAFGLSKELGIDMKKASQFIDNYFKQFTRVHNFIDLCIKKVKENKKTTTYIGRERFIYEIESKNAIQRQAAYRLAVNTPIQGTAADLIKLAMLKIHQTIKDKSLKGYLIIQIHDELIFEIPKDEISYFKSMVKSHMENIWTLLVPLKVNIAIGKNWREC